MITTSEIIAIVFRLINFGVIVGLIAYLFKNRALPVIVRKIKEHIAQTQALKDEQELLAQRHQQMLKELAADEQIAIKLKNRIDQWAHAVREEMLDREMQKDRQREYVQKQMEYREYERARLKAYDTITRAAIKEVERNMEHTLLDEKKSQEYFSHLINSLSMRGR